MKKKFVVLRTTEGPARRTSFPAVKGGGGSRSVSKAARPRDTKEIKTFVEVDRFEPNKVADLAAKKEIAAIAPVMPMKLIKPRKGRKLAKLNGMSNAWGIEATGAHLSPFDGSGVTVAVLDTGIELRHPAFKGIKNILKKDFTGEGITDKDGHGTHCAGTIFGRDVDNLRIGVAPGVQDVLIGKVLGANGGGSDLIATAINWAVDNGANIISMSIGIDFPGYVRELKEDGVPVDLATSIALEEYRANVRLFESLAKYVSSREAFSKPVILVAAAGNESRREVNADYVISVSPPAVSEGFLSVGALGQDNGGWSIASFSNTNPMITGPGVDILSAGLAKDLVSLSGTSMATPHVAGIAALWAQKLSSRDTFPVREVLSKLTENANKTGLKKGFDPKAVGSGMVQAPKA